jgi:FkbM family methyltransferase
MIFKQKIFHYIRRFGIYHGLVLFFGVRRSGKTGIISFGIPGLPFPVSLRRETSDFLVFEEIFIEQQYQFPAPEGPLPIIIDAGANIGLSALYFLRRHPSARIICLEPEDSNFELLCTNLICYPGVILLKKGLWHSAALLAIQDISAPKWGFELSEATDEHGGIEGVTVSDLIRDYKLPVIDLMKVDIEGSEREVFGNSSLAWLGQVRRLIIEVHENSRPGANAVMQRICDTRLYDYQARGSHYYFVLKNE